MIAPRPSVYPASELEVTLDKAFLDASAAASRDEDDEDVWLPQLTCVTPVLRTSYKLTGFILSTTLRGQCS